MPSRSCPTTPVKPPREVAASVTMTPSRHSRRKKEVESLKLGEDNTALFESHSFGKPSIAIDASTKLIYKVVQTATGALGGNGSTGAIYGELTIGSMQRILNTLKELCDLNKNSRFIDVGAGLGKPNFHAAQYPAVRLSIGIELEDIRYQLSLVNLKNALAHKESSPGGSLKGHTHFMVGDIDMATTMDPFTHIYMYDLGFPPSLQKSIAKKFNSSQHALYLVSYRPPRTIIDDHLYAVEFLESVMTSMCGSSEGHTAYIYKRTAASIAAAQKSEKAVKSENKKLELVARPQHEDEKDESVFCDPAFFETCRLAAAIDNSELKEFVNNAVASHLSSGRSVRERKPRVFYEATK